MKFIKGLSLVCLLCLQSGFVFEKCMYGKHNLNNNVVRNKLKLDVRNKRMQIKKCQKKTKIVIDNMTFKKLSENNFKGIYEAITGHEVKFGRMYIRKNEAERAGLYFVLTFANSISFLPDKTKIKVNFITNSSPIEKTTTWIFRKPKYKLHFYDEIWLWVGKSCDDFISNEILGEIDDIEKNKMCMSKDLKLSTFNGKNMFLIDNKNDNLSKKIDQKIGQSLVAWHIEIFSDSGELLASKSSYAW